jgi:hypothetical protein
VRAANHCTLGCRLAIRLANRVTQMGFYSRTALFGGNCAVAYLYGELDACSVTSLRARLAPVAMTGRDIIVDPAGLSFVDTTLNCTYRSAARRHHSGRIAAIDGTAPAVRASAWARRDERYIHGRRPWAKWLSPQAAGARRNAADVLSLTPARPASRAFPAPWGRCGCAGEFPR